MYKPIKKHKIAPELKEQIINRIKNDGITVVQAAKDHGISEGTIYTWLSKRIEGQPTLAEIVRLKRENAQLLQLVGEITLKLSETQKKKWEKKEKHPKLSGPERAGCFQGNALLPTKKARTWLTIEMSDWGGIKKASVIRLAAYRFDT